MQLSRNPMIPTNRDGLPAVFRSSVIRRIPTPLLSNRADAVIKRWRRASQRHKTRVDRAGYLPYTNRRTGSGPVRPHRYYQHPEMNPQSQDIRKEQSSHHSLRAEDNVMPSLPASILLLQSDHNWYTIIFINCCGGLSLTQMLWYYLEWILLPSSHATKVDFEHQYSLPNRYCSTMAMLIVILIIPTIRMGFR